MTCISMRKWHQTEALSPPGRDRSRRRAPLPHHPPQVSLGLPSIGVRPALSILRSRTDTFPPVLTNAGAILQSGDR